VEETEIGCYEQQNNGYEKVRINSSECFGKFIFL